MRWSRDRLTLQPESAWCVVVTSRLFLEGRPIVRGTIDLRDSGTKGRTIARAVAGMKVTPKAARQPALLVVYDMPSTESALTLDAFRLQQSARSTLDSTMSVAKWTHI